VNDVNARPSWDDILARLQQQLYQAHRNWQSRCATLHAELGAYGHAIVPNFIKPDVLDSLSCEGDMICERAQSLLDPVHLDASRNETVWLTHERTMLFDSAHDRICVSIVDHVYSDIGTVSVRARGLHNGVAVSLLVGLGKAGKALRRVASQYFSLRRANSVRPETV
jgi:hypothetical protein